MELEYLHTVIIVGAAVYTLLIFMAGYLLGKIKEQERATRILENYFYLQTSQPTQPSGTRDAERGSDDTG